MAFTNVLSQDFAVQTLRRALNSNKTPHAYLFVGPPGVGKHLVAETLSAALNCLEKTDDACGNCISCRKIAKNVHPDVFCVTLPNEKKSIPVESVRELEKTLKTKPHEGRAKVAIIDPADKMTESASNAILKTLEEPGPGRYLILISSRAAALLPTIRSRCQIVMFTPLPSLTIEKLLISRGISHENAVLASSLSGGSMTDALSYLEEDTITKIDCLFKFLSSLNAKTPLSGLDSIDLVKTGKNGIRTETLSFLHLSTIVMSEILWIITHSQEDITEHPLCNVFEKKIKSIIGTISVSELTDSVYAFHHAEQSILNNNMNPQSALEEALMSIRSPSRNKSAGSGFSRS